jgi:uncharacterized protein YbgA (DUF1722 family)/uncharacterized protein YbbK (DUF523 family)
MSTRIEAGRPAARLSFSSREIVKPQVVVSRCLGFEACRYDGWRISAPFVAKLAPFVRFVPVCPEAEIGLGTPRAPVRLVAGGETIRLVQPETNVDVTESITAFGREFASGLEEVDGFILKNRSPSCGIRDAKIYPNGNGGPGASRGPGMFARAVLERFPQTAIENEGRLRNLPIREHFLTRLFALARLRAARAAGTMHDLVRFHSEHKLLLMAFSQKHLRLLGKAVANHHRLDARSVWHLYASSFAAALSRPPRRASNVNVLMHALGYFSDSLAARENAHFLRVLDRYREGRYPLSTPVAVVRSWLARFERSYLEEQRFFEPYPEELVELTDSGKGMETW